MQEFWLVPSIRKIESNLFKKIDLEDIAFRAGYSLSHFHKLFFTVTGFTMKEYIRRRRLSCAAHELQISNEKIGNLAMKYQFKSQESFSRAIVKEFGLTPLKLRNTKLKLDLFPELNPTKLAASYDTIDIASLNPQLIEMKDIRLVGKKRRLKPNDPDFQKLWRDVETNFHEIENKIKKDKSYWFYTNVDYCSDGIALEFESYASFELKTKANAPKGWEKCTIKNGSYYCFTHKGETWKLHLTYRYIYGKWLPEHNMKPSGNIDFEIYDHRFKPDSPESEIFIMIPICCEEK
jgi:AraC family transcriptional regulator